MRAMRMANPTMQALADEMEREEVIRWSTSLTRARVTRWGGMISTPDELLQVGFFRFASHCCVHETLQMLYSTIHHS